MKSTVNDLDIRAVFNKNFNNLISFWDYLSSIKQFLYLLVNKESKHLKINPIFLCKSLCQNSKQQTWFCFLSFTFILFFLFFFILFFIFILLFVILNLDKGMATPVTSHVTITELSQSHNHVTQRRIQKVLEQITIRSTV